MGKGFFVPLSQFLAILRRISRLRDYCGPSGCVKIPTSLQPANGHFTTTGFYPDGSKCGTETCYVIFRCPCGANLGLNICDGGTETCDCGPLTGEICEKALSDGKPDEVATSSSEAPEEESSTSVRLASVSPEVDLERLGLSRLSRGSQLLLQKTISFFAAMESVHMEANVRIFISGSERADGEDVMKSGSFSFWEEAGRFRIKSEVDPRLGLAPNMEFAFDGVNYQNLLTEDATLSIFSEDSHRYPTAVPNPLFLVVDFLSPDQSQCPTCTLFVKDFRDESTWSARLEKARESTTKAAEREIFVPADSGNGTGIVYRIAFNDDKQIHKIDRLTADGALLAALDFHGYRPVREGDPSFPRSITMTSFSADGAVAARIVYEIETLETGGRVAFDVFSIAADGLRVLAGDSGDHGK